MSYFSTLLVVMRKELLDLKRDRRTLLLVLLIAPLLYPALMLGMGSLAEKRIRTQIDSVMTVPVIGQNHAPNLIDFLHAYGINAAAPPDDLEQSIRQQKVDVALRIDSGFAEDWAAGRPALVEIIRDSTQRDADIPANRLQMALAAYGQQVGALRLLARGIDPGVSHPLDVGVQDMASAQAKRSMILALLLPVLLTITSFTGGAYLILDATAGERERQSLEPLLTTPASRGAIVSGKIAAACLVGLATLFLTLLAFKLTALFSTDIAKQLNVSTRAISLMLVILVPMLFIGTSLLTLLAASAKSMKEAQSHMTWLVLLPLIPSYALMVNPLKNQLWQFAVPFLAQNQLLLKVIRYEPVSAQTWGVYLISSCSLAIILWFAAVWRYQQEKLAISG